LKFLKTTISSFFGVGYFPTVPGTFSAFITLVLLYIIPELTVFQYIILSVFLFLLGIWSSGEMETKGKDPSFVVIDEVTGMVISIILLKKTILLWIIAFILFRIFDIFKPFPINKSQKLESGLGIMADDVIAGIYTVVSIEILQIVKIL